jgi:succinate dehydrogenase flavin-adding protein (antitoxin of CptAB toxin-antitoxin module)
MRNIPSQGREHRDVRCRRLLFRCWHRGTQESDLILGAGGYLEMNVYKPLMIANLAQSITP